YRRIAQCKVAGGNQDIGTAAPDKFGKQPLLCPEATGAEVRRPFDVPDVVGASEFGVQTGGEKESGSNVSASFKLWDEVANVGQAATSAGRQSIHKKVNHGAWVIAALRTMGAGRVVQR